MALSSAFVMLIGKLKALSLTTKIVAVVVATTAVGGSIATVVVLNNQSEQISETPTPQDPPTVGSSTTEPVDEGLQNTETATEENGDDKVQSEETQQNNHKVQVDSVPTTQPDTKPSSSNPYEAAMAQNPAPDIIYGVCPPERLFNSQSSGHYALGAIGIKQNMNRDKGWKGETEETWEFYIARRHIGQSWNPSGMTIFRDGTGISETLPNTVGIGLSLWHMGTYEWGLIQDLPKVPDTIYPDGDRGLTGNGWNIKFGYSLLTEKVAWYIIGTYPEHRWSRSEMSARDIAAMDNLAKNIENYIHELNQRFAAKCPGLLQ